MTTTPVQTKHLVIGSTLDNGAIVIDYRADEGESDGWYLPGGVVLAMFNGADPYVTWNYGVRADGTVTCSNGHYFDMIEPAVADFLRRAA